MSESDINTHVVLVVGIVQKGNKFLLSKRSSKDPQAGGEWSTPGGKVDLEVGDAVIEQTLTREIEEEVGIIISPKVVYLGSDAFFRVSGHHVVGLNFLCQWQSGEAQPLEDQDEVGWFTLVELEAMDLPKYLKKRIELVKQHLNKL